MSEINVMSPLTPNLTPNLTPPLTPKEITIKTNIEYEKETV
jgi:hypothetical protein